jgi:hypothetical protein
MNLKPNETAAILAGKHPEIVRPHEGSCPFEVGEEIVLKTTNTINGPIPEVSITVTGHHRHRNGAWEALYSVKDDRGVYVNRGLGYTRSPSGSLDPEAPVLDPEVIEDYAMEAQAKTALQGAERAAEQKQEGKEARKGGSRRSERAITRHRSNIERRIR